MRNLGKSKEMLNFSQESGKLRPTQMNLDLQQLIHSARSIANKTFRNLIFCHNCQSSNPRIEIRARRGVKLG